MASDVWKDHRTQRGSAMMLMPAAILILVILASLALDRALVFGAQRELVMEAQAAANDAVSAGVDPDRLRGDGVVALDPERVARAVTQAVDATDGETSVTWEIEDQSVVVHLERSVRYLFAPAVPGGARRQRVTATASADLRRR